MSKTIKLVPPLKAAEQNQLDAVKVLDIELTRAQAGGVVEVLVVTKDIDGLWTHHSTGTLGLRETVGAIESLKWDLFYRNREEG